MFTHAIARKPGPNFAQGLTTSVNKEPPNYDILVNQHEEYIAANAKRVVRLLDGHVESDTPMQA